MKRIVLILCIFSIGVTCAWADDPVMTETAVRHTITNGVVKSFSLADPVKGTKSEIVVLDSSKKPVHVYVTPTTTFWDADAKDITADKILPRQHVNVIYSTTPEGINIGESIKILK